MIKLHDRIWTQVDGDINIATYGGTIARLDGEAIELLKIQPVRDYVGEREAIDVGFPFWTRAAHYSFDELDDLDAHYGALPCVGLDRETLYGMDVMTRRVAVACARLDYGDCVDEGPAGWAEDIFASPQRCRWYGAKRASGWRWLADEVQEFRRLLRERE